MQLIKWIQILISLVNLEGGCKSPARLHLIQVLDKALLLLVLYAQGIYDTRFICSRIGCYVETLAFPRSRIILEASMYKIIEIRVFPSSG